MFGFRPDIENNQILFGLKGMLNIGDDIIVKIIENRPYISPRDFLNRINPSRQVMISLIKGGAFDEMMERRLCMAWYIWETCDKKKRLTLQNMNGLIQYNLLPQKTEEQINARKAFDLNKYLKTNCKNGLYYNLDTNAINTLQDIDYPLASEEISIKAWEKFYNKEMDVFRNWITKHKEETLQKMNEMIFLADWNKYAKGTISQWEMEVLCFYYHEHELTHLDSIKYGFVDFFKLPEEPIVEKTFMKNGREIPIFKLFKICGTCIAKNKTKSTVTLLTTSGVVEVKFRKEYFALFDKQISVRGSDGVKHVVEKSWFNRGNMIVVLGMRSGDNFIAKKYASSASAHQLYRITQITSNGKDIVLQDERYQGGEAEDEI